MLKRYPTAGHGGSHCGGCSRWSSKTAAINCDKRQRPIIVRKELPKRNKTSMEHVRDKYIHDHVAALSEGSDRSLRGGEKFTKLDFADTFLADGGGQGISTVPSH